MLCFLWSLRTDSPECYRSDTECFRRRRDDRSECFVGYEDKVCLSGKSTLAPTIQLTVQVSMTTPLFASPLLSFAASAFSLDRDNSAFASHRERSQGARAKISVCPAYSRSSR